VRSGKKIYFASDFHLGVPDYKKSLEREKRIVRWLDEIKKDAEELYLMGDVFDFWFEYGTVVPKGFVRLQGKLAELSDSGTTIHYFTGNHDMWVFNYLPEEMNIKLYRKPITREISGKKFYLGHGDGLGPGDRGYKFIKKIFRSRLCQWLFARIHPNLGIRIARFWSRRSRIATGVKDDQYLGDEKELLVLHCKKILEKAHFDYFIFGHRHMPLDIKLSEKSRYINLGEWVNYSSYAVFDGNAVELKNFNG
jgi:UDP-2,3-diacylglucosamine hydrolase